MFIEQSLQALVLWVSINLGLTLILALNVTRHRAKEGVPVGSGSSEILERAIPVSYTHLTLPTKA